MADLTKLPQVPSACQPAGITDQRGKDAFLCRFGTATNEVVKTAALSQSPNGDGGAYPDQSGSYTKGLRQKSFGVVDPSVFIAFNKALSSNNPSELGNFDLPGIQLGGSRTLNGPRGAFARQLVGGDSENFGSSIVPPAPPVASKEYAVELIELYWASLLRDVPFTQYAGNQTAIDAAKELTKHVKWYAGPLDAGKVTPRVLFKGGFNGTRSKYFAGEQFGPYISQFCITPTKLGAQSLDQMMQTYVPGLDYMTDITQWGLIQNGYMPPVGNIPDPQRRYMRNGRSLGAFTHQDELYQAYLLAFLVLETLAKTYPSIDFDNQKDPYKSLKNDNGFGTFGGPDVAATLGAVAKAALNAVWYQKWVVHLRHRPESGGGIVHLIKNPQLGSTQAKVDNLVLNSKALAASYQLHGSYLLSQAFPEGSPTHPAYPTGHGSVAGACITVLKFFYNGSATVPNPKVPSSDGLSLVNYQEPDAAKMTVNGELHKLAHNISFGHGIHAGIHWRSDTDYSMLLGEEVALRFLQDQAWSYQEQVKVDITKMDGSTITIKNF
jgi:hypothetical protein